MPTSNCGEYVVVLRDDDCDDTVFLHKMGFCYHQCVIWSHSSFSWDDLSIFFRSFWWNDHAILFWHFLWDDLSIFFWRFLWDWSWSFSLFFFNASAEFAAVETEDKEEGLRGEQETAAGGWPPNCTRERCKKLNASHLVYIIFIIQGLIDWIHMEMFPVLISVTNLDMPEYSPHGRSKILQFSNFPEHI